MGRKNASYYTAIDKDIVDKREKIARILMIRDGLNDDWYYDCRGSTKDLSIGETVKRYESEAETFMALLKEPPVLTRDEIDALVRKLEVEYEDIDMTDAEWEMTVWQKIAQARRDSDIKWRE